jgi:DNA repair protein RecO (recombination protein O)
MSTYRATGINLKTMPMGEADRLLTILTREYGLVQAIAMGSRKHNSSLTGRSGLFVVNNLLIAKGRSLDKITQAETLESYPGLGQDLRKLTASQYIAELSLYQALSDQPQEELFVTLNHHLAQIEQSIAHQILPNLLQAIVHLLALAGIAPQVHRCCMTGQTLIPEIENPDWRIGFSISAGGAVTLASLEQLSQKGTRPKQRFAAEKATGYAPTYPSKARAAQHRSSPNRQLSASELLLLQALSQNDLAKFANISNLASPISPQEAIQSLIPDCVFSPSHEIWLAVEQLLRQYAQYHFDRPIRSASLVDACFLELSRSSQDPSSQGPPSQGPPSQAH